MSFTNNEWNMNAQGTGLGHVKSKQVIKVVNGVKQTLKQLSPRVPDQLRQTNRTFLGSQGPASEKPQRPPSRGSTRAHTVLDFDWYGNARDVSVP